MKSSSYEARRKFHKYELTVARHSSISRGPYDNPTGIHAGRSVAWLLLSVLALAATGTHCADGKRFDCHIFCQTTGYHGTIAGCRCTFNLFTSKRSLPLPSSLNPRGTTGDGVAVAEIPVHIARGSKHERIRDITVAAMLPTNRRSLTHYSPKIIVEDGNSNHHFRFTGRP